MLALRYNHAANLEWSDRKSNMIHAVMNRRVKSGENHRDAKLTEDQVRQIRKEATGNPHFNQSEIAKIYKVHSSCISRVLSGKCYSHVI